MKTCVVAVQTFLILIVLCVLTLTYKLIPYEVIIQHHKANHGKLWQVDLELKALIKDRVIPVLGHCPGAALCAVSWYAVDLHIHIWVHHIPFGLRTSWLGQVLATYHLEEASPYWLLSMHCLLLEHNHEFREIFQVVTTSIFFKALVIILIIHDIAHTQMIVGCTW